MRTRLAIAGVSLLLSLAILELGLRVAGAIYLRAHVPHARDGETFRLDDRATRVLCVGDSFTLGSKVPPDGTYPHFLSVFLNEGSDRRYQVINQGVCEYNSWQLLQFLPTWLDRYQPQVVCLLVGSSNRFNPWGYDFSRQASRSVWTRAGDSIRSLRIVKMLRIMTVNLKARRLALNSTNRPDPYYGKDGRMRTPDRYQMAKKDLERFLQIRAAETNVPWTEPWARFNSGDPDAAINLCRKRIDDGRAGEPATLLCSLGFFLLDKEDYAGANAAYVRALDVAPENELVLRQLAFFHSNAGRGYIRMQEYGLAIDHLFQGIRFNPHDEYLYYAMSKAYELQSRRDAETIVRQCRDLLKESPSLAQNPKFMNHIRMFEHYGTWEASARAWLERDLRRIVDLCKGRRVELVVENYPVDYPLANAVLAKVAAEGGLSFVDHTTRFKQLTANGRRETYLLDDDHCTAAGHREMARSVYQVLVQKRSGEK